MPRSLTRKELEALPQFTKIVVTFAGGNGSRRTVSGSLIKSWLGGSGGDPLLRLSVDGFFVATLHPGDGLDEDFVAVYEGADPAPQRKEAE